MSGLFLVSFQTLTGVPIGGVLTLLRSREILGTNLYGEILKGQSVGQVHTQGVRMIRLPEDKNVARRIVLIQVPVPYVPIIQVSVSLFAIFLVLVTVIDYCRMKVIQDVLMQLLFD